MLRQRGSFGCMAAAVSLGMAFCAGLSTAADASPRWLLADVTFDDGTQATGKFSINQYGFLEDTAIQTQSLGAFTGYLYGSSNSAMNAGGTILDLNHDLNVYTSFLHFEFLNSVLTPGSGVDPVIVAGASYECAGYENYPSPNPDAPVGGYCNASSPIRYVTNVDARLLVPEPATLALFGAGLAGLAALRRRKPKA